MLRLLFIQSLAGLVDDHLHLEVIFDQPLSTFKAQYQAQLVPHIELLNQLMAGLIVQINLALQPKSSLHGFDVDVHAIQAMKLRFGLNS